jgi:hypothetical protein
MDVFDTKAHRRLPRQGVVFFDHMDFPVAWLEDPFAEGAIAEDGAIAEWGEVWRAAKQALVPSLARAAVIYPELDGESWRPQGNHGSPLVTGHAPVSLLGLTPVHQGDYGLQGRGLAAGGQEQVYISARALDRNGGPLSESR